MDRSKVAYLITRSYHQDDLLQYVADEDKRKVFVSQQSVAQSEFFQAGQAGFKPELQLTMFGPEYHGETEVELDGIRYTIYRTYARRSDEIELYLQRRVGS